MAWNTQSLRAGCYRTGRKVPTSEPGTQGTGIVFSHRTGHRTCKKHYQYSGKNETKEHSVWGNGRTGRRYCRHQDHLSVCGRYSKSVGSDRRAFRYGNQMYQRLYCTSEREWLPKLSSGYLLSCRDIKWPEKDPGRDSDTNDGNEFLGNHRAFSAV